MTLALVDLIHGDRNELLTREIEPFNLQCAVALHMGNAFLFLNTGQIYKLALDSQTLQSIEEDFWKDSGVDLCPGPPFFEHLEFPRYRSHPFFDSDGGILLALEGFRSELITGSELNELLQEPMYEKGRRVWKAKGLYPFQDGKMYDTGVRSAILLKFDPEAKTMRTESLERVKSLCRENPDSRGSKNKVLMFLQSEGAGDLFAGPGGKILPLVLSNLTRDEPAQAVPGKAGKPELVPPKK